MVSFILLQKKYAGIAKSVEQLIRNQQVVCSSHITSSNRGKPWLAPVSVSKKSFRHAERIFKLLKKFENTC